MVKAARSLGLCMVAAAIGLAAPVAAQVAGDMVTPQDAGAAAAIAGAIADPSRPPAEVAQDAGRRPAAILAMLELKPGQRILDIAAGGGYYTRLLADVAGPQGVVFAHSTDGLLAVDRLQPRWSVVKRDHPNVRLILGIPGQMKLPGCDRVLMHLAFHDLWWEDAEYAIPHMDADRFLADLHAALAPGGLVLIVDHRARAGAEPHAETMAHHRIDPAVVKAYMERAGFVLDGESNLLASPGDDLTRLVYDPAVRGRTDRFILRFRRP